MLDYRIIELEGLNERFARLFERNLFSLGYPTKLDRLHELLSEDIAVGDIRAASLSRACDLLYLSIESSKNFVFQNATHKETLLSGEKFEAVYHDLLDRLLDEMNLNRINYLYQKIPTIRVHFPEMNTSSIWHRDTDFGHPKGEINFWIPLTEISPSTSLWFRDKDDVCPNVKLGKALCFDGDTIHGTKVNDTAYTRVSLDFRIIAKSDFDAYKRLQPNSVSLARDLSFVNDYYNDFS